MENYVEVVPNEEYKLITVRFHNELEKPLQIGEKLNQLNEQAYMNGYNWDALFNYFLAKHHPNLLEGLEPDPEAGSYFAHYPLTPENQKKAEAFAALIINFIEHEEKLYELVKKEGDFIEWD